MEPNDFKEAQALIASLRADLEAEKAAHAATVVRMQRWIDEAVENHRVEQAAHFAKSQELVELHATCKELSKKYDPEIKAEQAAKHLARAATLRAEAEQAEAEARKLSVKRGAP